MNLQIHHVINDITGVTGLAIVDAILAGQRDGAELAKLRDPHIKADTETLRKSLDGNWRPEHLFTLRQSRDLYRIYQQQIVSCDLEIEKMLRDFELRTDPAERPLPLDRKRNRAGSKRRKKNGHPHPEFDLRTETYKLLGVDVTQIPGIAENALPLFSEVGRDMSPWPSAIHSWRIIQYKGTASLRPSLPWRSSVPAAKPEGPGLFCIGEVVDETGQLGGFNFQWAWASGVCAGHAL